MEQPFDHQTLARFWGKVQKGPGCWLWNANRDACGYGFFKLGGKNLKAHRLSFEIANGPIPEGMLVMHSCDNPSCVNPAHLSLGNPKANAVDRMTKGRGGDLRGVNNGRSKLNESIVGWIRGLAAAGWSNRQIARAFHVSDVLISKIVRRKLWTHIQEVSNDR